MKGLNHGRATAEVLATNTSTNDKTGTKWLPNDGTWSKNPYVPEEEQSNKLDQTLFSYLIIQICKQFYLIVTVLKSDDILQTANIGQVITRIINCST